jgi:hypothetical protein
MTKAKLEQWLEAFIASHGGIAGTVHTMGTEVLELAAAVRIPDKVQELTARIPKGKGMAGLAWERGAPVQTCNLQTDTSGDVRPGARAVDAQAAVALPVHDAAGALVAVVGIAFAEEGDIGEPRVDALNRAASALPLG